MLLICEMTALSFVARHYYRRHLEVPYEDRIHESLVDRQTSTTSTLERTNEYGTARPHNNAGSNPGLPNERVQPARSDVTTGTDAASVDDVVVCLDNITQSMSSA